MSLGNYAWFEVTQSFFRVKFVDNIDASTLVNENFVVQTTDATPATLPNPFLAINVASDFDSISRILTLWWDNSPVVETTYNLVITGVKTFFGEDVGPFSIEFDWDIPESATPDEELRPDREPIDVEDYSIKTPGWSVVDDDGTEDIEEFFAADLTLVDMAPPLQRHHYIETDANDGRIDLLFSRPIMMNFISPVYFQLTKKVVKKGIAQWEAVDTFVTTNYDCTIISIYLPAAGVESATPVYSTVVDDDEEMIYFEEQTKYRLVISASIGS